jgi:DNA-3-methyladenine glycosylase
LDRGFFERSALDVAQALIGVELTYNGAGGLIVETEAYLADDPASHSFKGPSARNSVMFGPPGHAYVYLIYGMHWCLNAVCWPGSAVLIRALQPARGIDVMRKRRNVLDNRLLCSGPGRLCQALAIGREQNGLALDRRPFSLKSAAAGHSIAIGKRIGISRAVDHPWRFGLSGSEYISRKF